MDRDLAYALRMEERSQLAWTARIINRPKCVRCGRHIQTERYIDLLDLTGKACDGCVCQDCIDACLRDSDALDGPEWDGDTEEYYGGDT